MVGGMCPQLVPLASSGEEIKAEPNVFAEEPAPQYDLDDLHARAMRRAGAAK